jgi:hypothetical protein
MFNNDQVVSQLCPFLFDTVGMLMVLAGCEEGSLFADLEMCVKVGKALPYNAGGMVAVLVNNLIFVSLGFSLSFAAATLGARSSVSLMMLTS